ncbi:MAG: FGGY-family carbohydrate kinase [Alphaproteobacteria bacterium]|nr:FGGY-family carbohydrate kinase [Alphaproteobacteria bacterium]
MEQLFVGVDVGTTSARAGVFDANGRLLGTARHPIAVWHEPGDIVEQSSADIWHACAAAVRGALTEAAVLPASVGGVGFDATCSLVALDPAGGPLTVSASGDRARNVIVWMDHRAIAEADKITATGDPVLRHVGGVISPEMEPPKLLWLKRHVSDTWRRAGHFLDLADFLTFRATGATVRSMCTLTCKWTYLAHERRWSRGFFDSIGLGDLLADGGHRIGLDIAEPGTALGQGLTEESAAALGLAPGTAVGAALIDAHAGGLGSIGGLDADDAPADVTERLAYIMGTSACIMATTDTPRFVPGVWGPYFSAMVPGLWLNEGGQSAAGAGIDHLVRSHPAYDEASRLAKAAGMDLLDFLERHALARFADIGSAASLARELHVLPEFLGNRSPYADPNARAVISGLDLDADLASLARLFVAGLCGLAYGLADVVDTMRSHDITCRMMVISGGAARSRLVRQIMADTTGLSVALPQSPEPVLLGAAMLGAVAAGTHRTLRDAMASMTRLGATTAATAPGMARFHAAKRRVYGLMRKLDQEGRLAMRALEHGPLKAAEADLAACC